MMICLLALQPPQGFRIVEAHECWHKSMTPLMESVQEMMGDRPIYFTFDIDAIEPSMCPGTGSDTQH